MGDAAEAALMAALYEKANEIMGEPQEKVVPVDEGILKVSGFVELPKIRGGEVFVKLGFGGPAESYAIIVHESAAQRLNRELDRSLGVPRVGQWKYLETPVLQAAPKMAEDLAEGVERAFQRLRASWAGCRTRCDQSCSRFSVPPEPAALSAVVLGLWRTLASHRERVACQAGPPGAASLK